MTQIHLEVEQDFFLHKVALSRRLLNFNLRFPCMGNIRRSIDKLTGSCITQTTQFKDYRANCYQKQKEHLQATKLKCQSINKYCKLIIMTQSLTINFRQKCIVELSIITLIHRCKQSTKHWFHNECRCWAHTIWAAYWRDISLMSND